MHYCIGRNLSYLIWSQSKLPMLQNGDKKDHYLSKYMTPVITQDEFGMIGCLQKKFAIGYVTQMRPESCLQNEGISR